MEGVPLAVNSSRRLEMERTTITVEGKGGDISCTIGMMIKRNSAGVRCYQTQGVWTQNKSPVPDVGVPQQMSRSDRNSNGGMAGENMHEAIVKPCYRKDESYEEKQICAKHACGNVTMAG